jgi:hypothetical protein
MANVLPNGIGGNVADDLITAEPLILSSPARIWYVDSQTGVVGNSGKDRKFPFLTLVEAVTAIGANDDHIIVMLSGHDETPVLGSAISQRISFVGEGSVDGIPTVILRGTQGELGVLFTIQAPRCEVRNIRFSELDGGGGNNGYIFGSSAAGCRIINCVFDMGEMIAEPGVELLSGCDDWLFENCVFRAIVTTASPAVRPLAGIRVSAATVGLKLESCTFDGGLHGFDDGSGNPYAFDSAAFVITPIRALNMSLLNGADFKLHEDTVGYVAPQTATGHAKVEW